MMAAGLIEVYPITTAQAKAVMAWLDNRPEIQYLNGVTVEHTPVAGNEEIAQNTLRISADGPAAVLQSLRSVIESEASSRGLTVTVSKGTPGRLDGVINGFRTYGTDIANRPALKAYVLEVLRENRSMSGPDTQTLKRFLSNHGIHSIAELKAWLNQT